MNPANQQPPTPHKYQLGQWAGHMAAYGPTAGPILKIEDRPEGIFYQVGKHWVKESDIILS